MLRVSQKRAFQLGVSSRHYTSFLWASPRGEGTQLELGTGPCPSDVNFLPHVLRELLASLHVITGSVLALGLWVEVSAPQPLCSVGPASHSRRSSRSLILWGDWPPRPRASPHSFGLQTPRRRLGVWCWEKQWKKTCWWLLSIQTSLCSPLGRDPECLVANGGVAVVWWASLPSPWPPSTPSFSRRCLVWLAGLQRSGKPARLPRRPARGRVAETCVQTGSAWEEGELFPSASRLLLAVSLVLPEAKKGWEFGKVKVHHCISLPFRFISLLRKPAWTFPTPPLPHPLSRSPNTQGHEIPFLLLMWKRLGNMFLSRRWVIRQKGRVRWGQGLGARVLPDSFRLCCDCKAHCAGGWGEAARLQAGQAPPWSVEWRRVDRTWAGNQRWVWPFQRLL